MRWLLPGAVALRVVAALFLVVGPWTDEPAELDGWDVARFTEIAEAPGRHWVDHDVEYPPGSVLAIEAIAQDGVVETHRMLVAVSLAIDLLIAGLVFSLGASLGASSRRGPRRGVAAAGLYLLLGLPLVPMGLVRFDLWSVALAVLAVAALAQRKPGAFAVTATAAALVKIWPALLLAAALAIGRRSAVVATMAVMAVSGLAWLYYGGWSLDPIDQVLSLRGATGWHVESLPGTLTALTTDAEPEQQLDAFRIGRLNESIVMIGRVLTVAAVAVLGWLGHRAHTQASNEGHSDDENSGGGSLDVEVMALVMLGSTAALLVTAPLLSPQFLLWLTPWAALVPLRRRNLPWPAMTTGLATVLTGGVLAAFGPPNLAEPLPAILLLGRNLVLVALVVVAARALQALGRSEDPLRHGGAGPGPAAAKS